MPNDTPFVDLSQPPASANQPLTDADKRGWDYANPPDDEYVRATEYHKHLVTISQAQQDHAMMLTGSLDALKSLLRKTVALTTAAPSHVDQP